MIHRMDVVTANNTPLRVIMIDQGETLPNHPAYRPDPPTSVVEFYDRRYNFTPDGQFITRYDHETIASREYGVGLIMYGAEPDWYIDPVTMRRIAQWVIHNEGR